MVPIPSASKRDECLAERDWPAVTSWIAESSDEDGILFRHDSLLVAASLRGGSGDDIVLNK